MNKHFKKVLQKLKTSKDFKALGFSRDEVKGIAAKIADDLELEDEASEEDVATAIDDAIESTMPFLKFSQAAAQRVISNFKKKHDQDNSGDDDDDDDLDNEGDEPKGSEGKGQQGRNKSKKDDDTPEWAKTLQDTITGLKEEVATLKKSNTSNGRRAKLEELLKGTEKFGTRKLKEFDRIKDTFKNDDDFDEYLEEVEEDLKDYNQERADAGLSLLGGSEAGSPNNKKDEPKEEKMTDAEIEALVNEF